MIRCTVPKNLSWLFKRSGRVVKSSPVNMNAYNAYNAINHISIWKRSIQDCSILRFLHTGTGSITGAVLFGMLIYRVMVCLSPTAPEPKSRSLGEYAEENGDTMPPALKGEVIIGEVMEGDAIRGEYGEWGICNLFKDLADSGPGEYGDIGRGILSGLGTGLLVGLPIAELCIVETSAHESDRIRGDDGRVVCVDVQVLSASESTPVIFEASDCSVVSVFSEASESVVSVLQSDVVEAAEDTESTEWCEISVGRSDRFGSRIEEEGGGLVLGGVVVIFERKLKYAAGGEIGVFSTSSRLSSVGDIIVAGL